MRGGKVLPKDYKLVKGARKMARQLRAFGDLPEDPVQFQIPTR